MERLVEIATEVRKVKKADTRIGPSGLCFDWNLALARRVHREGEPVRFVLGRFRTDSNGYRTHYWAVVGETVLDITGSQFNGSMDEPWPLVFVGVAGDRYEEDEDVTRAYL